MFRLNNSDLSSAPKKSKIAPIFRLGTQNTGAIAKINVYAVWIDNPGWQIDTTDLDLPIFTGSHTVLDVELDLLRVKINDYTIKDSAIQAVANNFWMSGSQIHFYHQDILPSQIEVTFRTTVIANNYLYSTTLPTNFTALTVTCNGLSFADDISQEIGTFYQDDAQLILYGSPAYKVDAPVEISGNLLISPPPAKKAIATFYLPQFQYIDAFEWLGKKFNSTDDARNPQNWEFTWDENSKLINAFVDFVSLPQFSISSSQEILRSSGVVEFNR